MRSNYFFIIFLAIFIVMVLVSTILPSWQENQKLRAKLVQLQAEVKQLRDKKEYQEQQLIELEKNPFYAEFLLRQHFHYGRKNEIHIK